MIPPEPLLALLAAEVPPAARRRLLLVAPALAGWADGEGARRFAARPAVLGAPPPVGALGEATWDAVLAVLPAGTAGEVGPSPAALAAALAGLVREGGRVLVATGLATVAEGDRPPPYEGLVAALAESRLLIRKELLADGSALPWDGHRHRVAGSDATLIVAERHGLTVRGTQATDEEALVELFRRSFHTERSPEHWRWRYRDAPGGRQRSSLALDESGRPIAHYGAYPVLWWDGQRRRHLRSHQVGDIMSAPEARGRGRGRTAALAQTARHFYAAHCWGRVDFDYGFHAAHSRGFSSRFLAVVDAEEVPFRALRPADLALPDGGGWRVRPLATAGAELDRLWRRARGGYGRLVVRDRRHLGWRYFDRPDVAYLVLGVFRWGRLVGWSVFRRRGSELAWVDALFLRRAAPAAALTVAGALERLGGDRVVAWFPPRPAWWHHELELLGLVAEPEPDRLALGMVCFSRPTDAEGFREDLYYAMGDGDLV